MILAKRKSGVRGYGPSKRARDCSRLRPDMLNRLTRQFIHKDAGVTDVLATAIKNSLRDGYGVHKLTWINQRVLGAREKTFDCISSLFLAT
jgi:hypothetical protein